MMGASSARSSSIVLNASGTSIWLCQCDCGTLSRPQLGDLRNGSAKSCGCLMRDKNAQRMTKHGHSLDTEKGYSVWQGMLNRCNNPANKDYIYYGGRGITVCDRWKDFSLFLLDMGVRPTPEHTIERKNNDGNYEPSNCVWATRKEQAQNKHALGYLTFNALVEAD